MTDERRPDDGEDGEYGEESHLGVAHFSETAIPAEEGEGPQSAAASRAKADPGSVQVRTSSRRTTSSPTRARSRLRDPPPSELGARMRTEYFEQMYAASPDPWGFRDRWYEQRKYALTLAALTRPRYRSAFEPGCSIGVLTARLALRCDHLLAVDLVESAVDQARARVVDAPPGAGHVVVDQWDAHDEWPDQTFDLVVVSEMLYYLDPPDARRFMDEAAAHLSPDGEIVLVHWRERVPEYPLTGDEAHETALDTTGLEVHAAYRDDDFVLHLLTRAGTASTATREGLRSHPDERSEA
jgi:SAM-dependent methyltransferase